jgi:glyceraldehyde-3-phosphate dehydrogenase/erythrose-4-phosphate dehydrogenase
MRKIAINGMGRIGSRTQSIGHTKFELVAVNDIVSAEAYLIK